jgi:type IV pilus assembly protein PilM
MATTIVGLDIGSESLRGVELKHAKKAQPTVLRYHEVPLPPGAVKSGEVVEVHTVAAALKHLWSTAGFGTRKVVLGMGNARVLVRDLTVARLSQKEIRQSLPFQVQEMLPVPVADALLDFYPVSEGRSENGPVLHGLLVAAVRDAVNANLAAVQLAGLTPLEVDLIPFALNRVLRRDSSARGTVALVDVGASTTNVVITSDGVPQFVRIIPAGGADVTSRLMSRLDMTADQAETSKRRMNMAVERAEPSHADALAIVRECSGELLNSLRNTLRYFTTTRQGGGIDRVVVSGRGSRLAGFAEALAELTGLPVQETDPFATLVVARNAHRAEDVTTDGMTVALGLALGSAA